jgi:hypothetical protein
MNDIWSSKHGPVITRQPPSKRQVAGSSPAGVASAPFAISWETRKETKQADVASAGNPYGGGLWSAVGLGFTGSDEPEAGRIGDTRIQGLRAPSRHFTGAP